MCVSHVFSSNFCFSNVFDIEIDTLITSYYTHVYVICMVTHIHVYVELEFPF